MRLQGRSGREHRVGRAQLFVLGKHLRRRCHLLQVLGHLPAASAHHHSPLLDTRRRHRRQHMTEQRLVAHRVQDLGQRRTHARALPGRENHRQRRPTKVVAHHHPPACIPASGRIAIEHIVGVRVPPVLNLRLVVDDDHFRTAERFQPLTP
ncbi:hypothetical protein D3C75_602020 [compost metagenome]